jgi:hypothetical protein
VREEARRLFPFIERVFADGGCVLRHYPEAGTCGGRRKDGELILQAEHLITRANAAMRNIVCLCEHHHGFFKPQHPRTYWRLVEREIGPERWKWLKRMEADKRPHKVDWAVVKGWLEQERLRAL